MVRIARTVDGKKFYWTGVLEENGRDKIRERTPVRENGEVLHPQDAANIIGESFADIEDVDVEYD
jgi:hypothetical protein